VASGNSSTSTPSVTASPSPEATSPHTTAPPQAPASNQASSLSQTTLTTLNQQEATPTRHLYNSHSHSNSESSQCLLNDCSQQQQQPTPAPSPLPHNQLHTIHQRPCSSTNARSTAALLQPHRQLQSQLRLLPQLPRPRRPLHQRPRQFRAQHLHRLPQEHQYSHQPQLPLQRQQEHQPTQKQLSPSLFRQVGLQTTACCMLAWVRHCLRSLDQGITAAANNLHHNNLCGISNVYVVGLNYIFVTPGTGAWQVAWECGEIQMAGRTWSKFCLYLQAALFVDG
jgi:hypothetical protein